MRPTSQCGAKDRSTGIRLRWLLAVVLFVVAAGCSSVKVGYNHADTLLIYTLDKYFDLNDAQDKLARERIRGLLAWHRATQLRGYAELVESAGKRLENDVTAPEVLALNLEMNRRMLIVGDRAAPDVAALALTLQPAQIERFAKHLAEDNHKMRREAGADSANPNEKRARRSIERTKEWFGSVSPRQRELIRQALVQRPDSEDWWLRERERRRADLLALLRKIQAERPSNELGAHWVREYFAHLAEPPEAERRARMSEYRHANAELIAALVNAASPEQRANLRKKVHGYADDFETLASIDQKRG